MKNVMEVAKANQERGFSFVPIEVFLYSHDAKGVQFLFTLPNFQLV
jgi:hypothetical protein